ncbi:hypothetical protein ACFX15_029311 [Malus domestica]
MPTTRATKMMTMGMKAQKMQQHMRQLLPLLCFGGGKKGEIGFPRWWFKYKSARLMWVSISRQFLEHASFMRDCFHRVMSKVFFVALRPETAIFSSLRSM